MEDNIKLWRKCYVFKIRYCFCAKIHNKWKLKSNFVLPFCGRLVLCNVSPSLSPLPSTRQQQQQRRQKSVVHARRRWYSANSWLFAWCRSFIVMSFSLSFSFIFFLPFCLFCWFASALLFYSAPSVLHTIAESYYSVAFLLLQRRRLSFSLARTQWLSLDGAAAGTALGMLWNCNF